MTDQEKLNTFSKELYFIEDTNIRNFVKKALTLVPDYFFHIPASSTGKWHPSYALGEGGLVRHTRAAVGIAHELFGIESFDKHYTSTEKDMIYAGLILHDTFKLGVKGSKYTVTEHPILAADFIAEEPKLDGIISKEQRNFIASVVATHMGQWTKDFKTHKDVLEKPKTKFQTFVHMCDYLASRKCLEFNFEV